MVRGMPSQVEIETDAVRTLRDRLVRLGAPPSWFSRAVAVLEGIAPVAPDVPGFDVFRALIEALFLQLSADGRIADEERAVLRGAARELTGGALSNAAIDRLLDQAAARLAAEGADARLHAVAAVLSRDRTAAETAFVLLATMTLADRVIEESERGMLARLRELVGVSEERADELLDDAPVDA
jgi:uncharacterized tellurite resistance protein B-like protein